MAQKKCFAPSYTNTSKNAPNKLFILVSLDHNRRTTWYKAVNEQYVPKGTHIYCCEDHFDVGKHKGADHVTLH